MDEDGRNGGSGRRRVRRCAAGAALVVMAVAAVVGGPTLMDVLRDDPSVALGVPADAPPEDAARPGTRLVGIGHVAIAVPEEWATNSIHCGTATEPTVVIDVIAIEACAWLSPEHFDNVWVERGLNRYMFEPDEHFEIDGIAAQRNVITCIRLGNRTRECSGTVYVPSEKASFTARAATKQRVEEMLFGIRVHRELVAVPGFGIANSNHQDDDAGEHYRAQLTTAGLGVDVVTERRPGFPAGYVLGVRPRPGTMVEPGQVVTMTEVADPRGPADEVQVEVNSVGPGDSMDYRGLSDEQIRNGGKIRIDLGATIWAYGNGKRINTLEGAVSGPALTLDDWKQGPNYGRSWKAVARGSSILTLTITADGRRIALGTVTVIVE